MIDQAGKDDGSCGPAHGEASGNSPTGRRSTKLLPNPSAKGVQHALAGFNHWRELIAVPFIAPDNDPLTILKSQISQRQIWHVDGRTYHR